MDDPIPWMTVGSVLAFLAMYMTANRRIRKYFDHESETKGHPLPLWFHLLVAAAVALPLLGLNLIL